MFKGKNGKGKGGRTGMRQSHFGEGNARGKGVAKPRFRRIFFWRRCKDGITRGLCYDKGVKVCFETGKQERSIRYVPLLGWMRLSYFGL